MLLAAVLQNEGPRAPPSSYLWECEGEQGRGSADAACLLIMFLWPSQEGGEGKIAALRALWLLALLPAVSHAWPLPLQTLTCLVFTQRLWRGGKVGVAPSITVTCSQESVVVSFPLPATQSSVAVPWGPPDFVDEAKRLETLVPTDPEQPQFFEVYGGYHLKVSSAEKSWRTIRLLETA